MTMNFRVVKAAVVALLENEAAGRFRIAPFQRKRVSAESIEGGNRLVSVYYWRGDFPKSDGSINGPMMHHISIQIDMMAAEQAQADLVSHDAFENASQRADASFDELVELVYQIIMDARQQNFGLDIPVADRWISDIQKDEPPEYGDFGIVTGGMLLTCKINENVLGDEGLVGSDGIDLFLESGDIDDQDVDTISTYAGVKEEQIYVIDHLGNYVIDNLGNFVVKGS